MSELLLEEIFFPACAPNFNGGKLPKTPADLAKVPLLRSDDELWRPWFDAAGLTDWPEPKRGVLYQDSSNLLQAAIDGQGVALTRRSLAMHEIAAGRLVRLFDVDGPSPWQYYFICPPQMLRNRRGSRRFATGCSTKWDASSSFSTGLARLRARAQAPIWRRTHCASRRRHERQ